MESMTDCAFSWPISGGQTYRVSFDLCSVGEWEGKSIGVGWYIYADNNLTHSSHGYGRCYVLFERTWSHG